MQKVCCISQLMVVAQRPPTGWSNKKSARHDAGCSYISWTEKQTDMGRSYIEPTPCCFLNFCAHSIKLFGFQATRMSIKISASVYVAAPRVVSHSHLRFYVAKRLAGKNVSKVTYLCPFGRKNLTQSVNRSGLPTVHGLLVYFLANVNFAICYRPSVCHLSVVFRL